MSAGHQRLIQDLFLALRGDGLNLGLAELLAALRAERDGYAAGPEGTDDLPGLLALLWCKSEADRWRLYRAYEAAQQPPPQAPSREQEPRQNIEGDDGQTQEPPQPQPVEPPQTPADKGESFGALPTRAPPAASMEENCPYYHYPLSRRDMRYAWRYLRRLVADGPCDVLDVTATVERVARQGFFLAPVLCCRERNQAHLVLLLDHLGSMIPFHHYLRALADTAMNESGLERVQVYYFYNVPDTALYTDALLQKSQTPWPDVLAGLDGASAVLIVSDAGAARHHNDLDRILATLEFLDSLAAATPHIAWLNPLPAPRWRDTSAEVLARHTRMFAMDREGLSHAVDALRGLHANQSG